MKSLADTITDVSYFEAPLASRGLTSDFPDSDFRLDLLVEDHQNR